jgi:hypothetical protein
MGEDSPRQTIKSCAGVRRKNMNRSCWVIIVPNSDISTPYWPTTGGCSQTGEAI